MSPEPSYGEDGQDEEQPQASRLSGRPDAPEENSLDKDSSLHSSSSEKHTNSGTVKGRKSVRFGARMSIVLTLSSLFVLVQNPEYDDGYPQGTWVYVSALMVSWFPSMDVASVAEKTMQRILGTILGACLGLICGFLSSLIHVYSLQALFIAISILIVTFSVSFVMVEYQSSIFAKYPYASLLCLMTFGISILPFYTDNEDEWTSAVFRVANVIIGCGIGAIGAIVLWPRSSLTVLKENVQEQVKLAGEASEAVLQFASETLEDRSSHHDNRKCNNGMTESKIGVEPDVDDSAYSKYSKAISKYKAAKSKFPLAKYDPYNLCRDRQSCEDYRKESALILSRAVRIQTTVALIDGVLRNDEVGVRCTERQRELFCEIGSLIKTMLTPPSNRKEGDSAADELLNRLDEIRQGVLQESAQVVSNASAEPKLFFGSLKKEEVKEMFSGEKVMSVLVHSGDNDSLLFLQLVEQLVIRALRLYFTWTVMEHGKVQADDGQGKPADEIPSCAAYRD